MPVSLNPEMKALVILLLVSPSCSGQNRFSAPRSDEVSKQLYAGLDRADQCDLRLVCTVAKFGDYNVRESDFMHGIKTLAVLRKNFKAFQLAMALKTGEQDGDCSVLSPKCSQTEDELLQAVQDMGIIKTGRYKRDLSFNPFRRKPVGFTPNRRQSPFANLPPMIRPEGATARKVCRACDSRSTVCTVYSIGTYAGCTGVWLVAGFPGQIACNVATLPGSIGCGMNTLHCYMESCGLVALPKLPKNLFQRPRV